MVVRNSSNKRLLDGITVLALEHAVAAPFCTVKLADQGARVIKIEREFGGDFARKYDNFSKGASSYFTWLNRGKESLAIDIKNHNSREFLINLIHDNHIDVFVQNLAPGAASRLGFGTEELRALNKRLITLDISGYGSSGPLAFYKAYDLLVAAESGLCSVTGTPDGPGRVGVSICDIMCGQNGYAAILQGLYQREKTGEGSAYSVSLFDSLAEIMNVPFVQAKYTGKEPPRLGLHHPSIAPYGVFASSEGSKFLISVQNEREWIKLCEEVLGMPKLSRDPLFCEPILRLKNRRKLDEILQVQFCKLDIATIKARLIAAAIAFGQLNSVKGLIEHPQLSQVTYKTEIGHKISVPAPAIKPYVEDYGDVPKLGQHNDSIFAEFSYLLKNVKTKV